jgi:hypothetical protein
MNTKGQSRAGQAEGCGVTTTAPDEREHLTGTDGHGGAVEDRASAELDVEVNGLGEDVSRFGGDGRCGPAA